MCFKHIFINLKYLGSEWCGWIYFYCIQFLFEIHGALDPSPLGNELVYSYPK